MGSDIKIYDRNHTHLIPILGFCNTFWMACDANCIHNGAIVRTIHGVIADPLESSLNSFVAQVHGTEEPAVTSNYISAAL